MVLLKSWFFRSSDPEQTLLYIFLQHLHEFLLESSGQSRVIVFYSSFLKDVSRNLVRNLVRKLQQEVSSCPQEL